MADIETMMSAAAGKRKGDELDAPEAKVFKAEVPMTAEAAALPITTAVGPPPSTEEAKPRAREVRLEQNRKAARESRKRKKIMIEELQRSVIFFSRANATLKGQNDELTRMLMQAQTQIANGDEDKPAAAVEVKPAAPAPTLTVEQDAKLQQEQAQAQAVATQAMYESQGFPAAAARAAAQTMTGSMPSMQPGATMQAMANFQQAAAQAMQQAMGAMSSVGLNVHQMAAVPVGTNPQQAYTDTMTALAMQQAAAAAAAAGQSFVLQQPGTGVQLIPQVVWHTAPTAQSAPVKTEDAPQQS